MSFVCAHILSIYTRISFVCQSYALVFHPYVTRSNRMSSVCHSYVLVCHPYVTRMYLYAIRMLLVCTRMSSVCHSYVIVCHSYVTRIYSYVICMSLVCTCMSSVCHSYGLVCHLYVTCMYSYVIRMSVVWTRMSFVCHSYVFLLWTTENNLLYSKQFWNREENYWKKSFYVKGEKRIRFMNQMSFQNSIYRVIYSQHWHSSSLHVALFS